MGESLGPVLGNIIMTECDKLIEDDIIKFYVRELTMPYFLSRKQIFHTL